MATRPVGVPKLSRRSRILLILGAVVLVALIVGSRLIGTYVNWLWFGGVDYRGIFTTIVLTRITLFVCAGVFLGGVLALNLWLAYRTRPVFVPLSGQDDPLARYRTVITQRSKWFGIGIPVAVGAIGGLAATGDWRMVQLFLNRQSFGTEDPVFGHDIGLYVFQLPFFRWLLAWAFIAVTLSFFAALATHYVFGGIKLAGRSGQISQAARIQLAVLAGIFVLLKAVDFFFDRWDLLLSQRSDLFTGASYTDLNAVMPAKVILLCISVICALAFFAVIFLRNLQIPALATVLLVLSSLVIGALWPALLQQFSVEPNANERESTSIERNMAATKQAFGITDDKVNVQENFGSGEEVTPEEVAQDTGTISNVRLLDPSLLSETFTQLEQQFNFYGFPKELDIDRYRDENGELQDYLVAVRGINTDGLADNQRSWINRHMVYTHGNGFVTAPADRVNTVPGEGDETGAYPVFSMSDVANDGQGEIPVEQPRVYYGELNRDYAIVGAEPGEQPKEYDTQNSRYTYQGDGGVAIGNWFNRAVFAAHYGERNILFNQNIGSNSKIMFDRNPRERVQKVAPWLKLDGDPYPAVVDGRITWIVDGYTTLDNYPYSTLTSFGGATSDSTSDPAQPNQQINYIRNSVKATVDAYTGEVTLYEFGEKDPVLEAWKGVFPGVVKPKSEISDELRQHFRYPADLFKVQRQLLARYHVDNPGDFYATRGFWEVPNDPNESQRSGPGEKQPPFYVIAQAPTQDKPTFQLTSAMTPLERQNLSAWISASSDPENYGELTVLELPTDNQTLGPGQVQRKMESTPKVTEDRTLFDNPGVRAMFGNLLTLPVKGGMLYVEPIYIRPNSEDSYPQLARVLTSYGDRVGYADTLQESLEQIFGEGAGRNAQTAEDEGDQQGDGQQQGGDQDGQDQQQGDGQQDEGQQGGDQQGGRSPEVDQAVQELQAALEQVRSAQQSGNLGELGSAFQRLEEAMNRYERVTGGN
ncbi:UPF0182 family protein [Actinopolyspora mortivallis]|uniref:UPF0182 protein CEP50_02880 n=1 Tax=Actinopolyspora mortivallis TaxID=33906 RepID=A0A2T0H0A0_ACTMO|nr:UPF0182 family protein [Actinopolyspora mortivallis]PRW64784.1 membrane protein [Actinopolyspora mortivallis]